jgi:allophanate hydrolase subunit 2
VGRDPSAGPDPSAGRDPSAGPADPGRLVLPVTLGPRADWFTPAAVAALATGTWRVSTASNRIGLRLTGGPDLDRRDARELPSEGLVLGSVQVPSDGEPVVFLADAPRTGGYPVVAVVDPAALAACAQARPGTPVSFRPR